MPAINPELLAHGVNIPTAQGLIGGLATVKGIEARTEGQTSRNKLMDLQLQRAPETMRRNDEAYAQAQEDRFMQLKIQAAGQYTSLYEANDIDGALRVFAETIKRVPQTPESQAQLQQITAALKSPSPEDNKAAADLLYRNANALKASVQEQGQASFGQPVAGVDESGNPVFMQFDKSGGSNVVPGFKPAPKSPLVNVNTADSKPSKWEEATGTKGAELYSAMQQGIANIPKMNVHLNAMENIAQSFKTGRQEDVMAAMGAWLGTDAGSARDVFNAQLTPLKLMLGEQVKGSMQVAEWDMLEQALPNFGVDQKATEEVIRLIRLGQQRQLENYRSATEYGNKHKHLRGWIPPNALYEQAPTPTEGQAGVADPLGIL